MAPHYHVAGESMVVEEHQCAPDQQKDYRRHDGLGVPPIRQSAMNRAHGPHCEVQLCGRISKRFLFFCVTDEGKQTNNKKERKQKVLDKGEEAFGL